jgi:hypothetical protein
MIASATKPSRASARPHERLATDPVVRSRPPGRLHWLVAIGSAGRYREVDPHLRRGRLGCRRERVRRRGSGWHERGSGRCLSQAGPAPESGGGIGAWFSESGIESLVRPGGWRRLRRFAGSTGGSNVAFRGITPDPAPAIQAGTGSGVDAGPVGRTRSINSQLS